MHTTQHYLEINTITLNPYGIYLGIQRPTFLLYQSYVVAVFMYQNECAINIFFKTTTTNNQLPKIQSKQKQIFSVWKERI